MDERLDEVAATVVQAVFEVRQELGAGLFESVYQACLVHALRQRGLEVKTEVSVPLVFRGERLPQRFKLDLLVEDSVIVEAKAQAELIPLHFAQLLTYLRLADKPLGLLVNFNAVPLKHGIRRLIAPPRG